MKAAGYMLLQLALAGLIALAAIALFLPAAVQTLGRRKTTIHEI